MSQNNKRPSFSSSNEKFMLEFLKDKCFSQFLRTKSNVNMSSILLLLRTAFKPCRKSLGHLVSKLHIQCYNHFHNILRLFDVLPNFPFTTSETMWDYYL